MQENNRAQKHQDQYSKIADYLRKITDVSLQEKVLRLHEETKEALLLNPASCQTHHKWEGGYIDHVYEVLEISIRQFFMITRDLKTEVDFSLDDVLIVAYLHDVNKLKKYQRTMEHWKMKKGIGFEVIPGTGNGDESAEVVAFCAKYGIHFEDKHLEAFSHHHGGFSVVFSSCYSYPGRMTALSSLIHSADLLSQYLYGG